MREGINQEGDDRHISANQGVNIRGAEFIQAYYEFKKSIDFTKGGVLPDLENLVWCMLMGVPYVPADEYTSEDASVEAIDQRVAILKAVFVEVNKDQTDDFLDQGLIIYDQASKRAKELLEEGGFEADLKRPIRINQDGAIV